MSPLDTCYCIRCRKLIPEEMSERRGLCDECAAAKVDTVCPFCNSPCHPNYRFIGPGISPLSGICGLLTFIAVIVYVEVSSGGQRFTMRWNLDDKMYLAVACAAVVMFIAAGLGLGEGGKARVTCPQCGKRCTPVRVVVASESNAGTSDPLRRNLAARDATENAGGVAAPLQRPVDSPKLPGEQWSADNERRLG